MKGVSIHPREKRFRVLSFECIGQICPLHTPAFFDLEDLRTAQTFFNFDLRAEYFYQESSFSVSRMRRRLKSKIELPSVFSLIVIIQIPYAIIQKRTFEAK